MKEHGIQPPVIVTTELCISHICFVHDDDAEVLLLAVGHRPEDDCLLTSLCIETDFNDLNRLLSHEGGYNTELAIERIAERLANPTGELEEIDFCGDCGVTVCSFIISLLPIALEDEPGSYYYPAEDELRYKLVGYTPRGASVPSFNEEHFGSTPAERQVYYRAVLLARYTMYRSLRQHWDEECARAYSKLEDELTFRFAETTSKLSNRNESNATG